jgi:pimeloyl-ACP methyl ester carboxylesterase
MPNDDFARLSGYPLTATPDSPDFRDFSYQPALVPLKPYLRRPPRLQVLDQGNEGACTGFALAAVINLLNDQRGRRYRVSPRMLYEAARRFDEWPGEEYEGSSCRGAIKGWYTMGVCREEHWRYDPARPGELTVARAKKARENTLGAYYRLHHRLSDFHAALNEAGVIFVSADVHAGWDLKAVKNGTIPRRAEVIGAHAFAIVGYNSQGFLVQNSWGRQWGSTGVAVWSYEDWQDNIRDAWVLRLALPTPQVWHKPPNAYSARLDDPEQIGRSPTRAEIAGHFVHIDDGRFHEHGRYWSTLADVRQTAELVARSKKYDHLLIYAHGGLNSPEDSARRIGAMKEVFKANRVYPYHVMYDTGLMEELKDVLLGRKDETRARVGGFDEWFDRLIERGTRTPGRALWREMKHGARSPFAPAGAGVAVLEAFRAAFLAAGEWKQLHLVGHSTGAILLAYLLEALEALGPTRRVRTCSLMAPAATIDLFHSHYRPLLGPQTPFGVDQMTVYNLTDQLERDDNVAAVYRKSLLYLVSRAFEEQTPAPLLGMQTHSAPLPDLAPGVLEVLYSSGPGPGVRSASTSHGGFDNDPHTMNDVLRRVLGADPPRPFRKDDLDY